LCRINGEKRKLLFLTNQQADLLSNTKGSMEKILDAFEVPKPKLVINLLKSLGTSSWFDGFSKDTPSGTVLGRGLIMNGLAWSTEEELMDALNR